MLLCTYIEANQIKKTKTKTKQNKHEKKENNSKILKDIWFFYSLSLISSFSRIKIRHASRSPGAADPDGAHLYRSTTASAITSPPTYTTSLFGCRSLSPVTLCRWEALYSTWLSSSLSPWVISYITTTYSIDIIGSDWNPRVYISLLYSSVCRFFEISHTSYNDVFRNS